MAFRGLPGLAVSELVASDLGSKDLQQGIARVFVKSNEEADHPIVLHEYLAARLAHSMGIPIPFGELAVIQQDARAWATAIVGIDGEVSAPPNPQDAALAEPHIYSGIAVFDAWLLNIDRTDANLIWTPDVGLWAIDHEQCFNAADPRQPQALRSIQSLVHRSQVYREVEPEPELMGRWANLVFNQGKRWVEAACDAAYQRRLASKAHVDQYRKFLLYRTENIMFLSAKTYNLERSDLLGQTPQGSIID